jgi:hypothetical protein
MTPTYNNSVVDEIKKVITTYSAGVQTLPLEEERIISELRRDNNDMAYEKTQLLLKYDKLQRIYNQEIDNNEIRIKDLEIEL